MFLEETFYVGGDLVFAAENEFIGVKEDFLRVRLGQGDLAADGDEHGGGGAASGVEEERDGFESEDFSAQDGVGAAWLGGDFVGRGGEKFVDRSGGEFLLDAVAGGGVLQCGHGDDVNIFRQGVGAVSDVIAAAERQGSGGEGE